MRKIVEFLKNKILLQELPKPLGRWKIDYCNKKINNKVDLSNEDHCGPCGNHKIKKDLLIQNKL